MKSPALIQQFHALQAQQADLRLQISDLEKALRPHEKAFRDAMNGYGSCVNSQQPVYKQQAETEKAAMERERELMTPINARLVELKEAAATVSAALADLSQGAGNRLELAKGLYWEAADELEQITRDRDLFQSRLPELELAISQHARTVDRLSADRDQALSAEGMTAAAAALAVATSELESARLLQRNIDRKVGELVERENAAIKALENARRQAWSAKTADMMDALRRDHLGAFAAAFAANVSAGAGGIRFGDFVSRAMSSPDWVLPDLSGHQQRIAADLGIPAA